MVINEDRTGEDYHMVKGATKPLHRQSSNNTTTTHNEHLIAEPLTIQQDPVNQIAIAIEKLARRNSQPSLFHPKNTLTFPNGKLEKNEKFEYFEDLLHTTLRMQPTFTEEMKINHFHAHLRGLAMKTFKNIQRTPTTKLEDILVVFRRKYVKPDSSASAKHRFHCLVFDPERQKLPDFLEELQESAEKAFGDIASQMIESLLYAKMPPHLKRSINQAYLENGTYEQIVRHLEREMELNGLASEDTGVKTQMAVINKPTEDKPTQQKTASTKKKQQTPKTVPNNTLQDDQCRYCKNTGHKAADCPKLAKRRKLEKITKTPTNKITRKHPTTTFIIEGFKLLKPRPTKPEEKDDWQHPTPHPIKTNTFTQQTDSQTPGTQQNESEDDLYEIYRDAHDRYITTNLDKSNEKTPENLFESEPESSPQNLFTRTSSEKQV